MAAFHQRTFGQPSQDTLFMRGFHIRQDVDDIRDYFYDEGRCSVVFFKENQHFQKLFIALKFESITTAKKVMKKYNDAEVMGDWIQLSWFKKPNYTDRRDEDRNDRTNEYRNNDDRRRRRYDSRSRSRSNGRSESPVPRRKKQNHASRISLHHTDSDDDYKKQIKDVPKRISRRKASTSSDGSRSIHSDTASPIKSIKVPVEHMHKIESPYKEPPSIWDKPDSKHELVLEPMKIEIKKIIPVAVPAPTISSTIPLISQLNHSTSSVTSSLLRTTKNTSRDSINTPISSPDYSSDSEPTPPIKVIKKRPLKKKIDHFDEDNEETAEEEDIENTQLNPLKSIKVKTPKVLTSFMQNSTASLSADLRKKVSHLSNENVNLVKLRKEEIEKSYRQDCETFSMVVKMLIGKDASLEEIIQDSLKQNLKCIGQRCIQDLRSYIETLRSNSIHDIF